MLKISSDMKPPSTQKCAEILRVHTDSFGIPLDFDRLTEYYAYYTSGAAKCRKLVGKYIGHDGFGEVKDSDIVGWLQRTGSHVAFPRTATGKISLSSESIQAATATGTVSKEVCAILKLYDQSKSMLKAISQFSTILDSCPELDSRRTYDGHRMIVVHPKWVPQNTGRLGMQDPGLMNIKKDLSDIETVPEGYVYITTDSGQIEPRIIQSAFLRDPLLKKCTMLYNDAYYGYVHYCTVLTDEQRRSGNLDIKPMEITDALKEKRKKFKTYGNAVMYGSTSNDEGDSDKDAFIKCIGGHINRKKWQSSVEQQIENGVRIFQSVFGTSIDITAGPSDDSYEDKQSNAYFSHLVRCAINNPIQATAADLMRFSVQAANELLLRTSDKSHILRYTHDSGTFAVHEDDYDKIAEQLKDITAYEVDDWIPIYAEPVEGVPIIGQLERMLK